MLTFGIVRPTREVTMRLCLCLRGKESRRWTSILRVGVLAMSNTRRSADFCSERRDITAELLILPLPYHHHPLQLADKTRLYRQQLPTPSSSLPCKPLSRSDLSLLAWALRSARCHPPSRHSNLNIDDSLQQ